MTAAAFTIFWMKIKLEWHSIIFCSFGAIFGIVLGFEVKQFKLTKRDKNFYNVPNSKH